MRIGLLGGVFALVAALVGVTPAGAGIAAENTPGAVEWQSGGTLFLAGRDVTVARDVDGSLTVTGETVTITRDTSVGKDAWIVARRVGVEGEIDGELSIRAQDALINGHVKGDVSFYGVSLAFGPDAEIDGDVNYYAATPAEIDSGARIAGSMRSKVWDDAKSRWTHRRSPGERRHWMVPGYRLSWPGAIFFGFLAGVVALAAPASASRLGEAARAQPGFAFLIGLVWFIGTPILAVMTAITIIGLPLAFIVILLWPLGILVGLVVAILVLGEIFAGRIPPGYEGSTRVIGGIVVATLLLWIGISLPAFGGFVWIAAVTFGVGALVLSARTQIV